MNRAWALLRNSWRQLTSMRTALVLLFLLALAAVPGSIFPQRPVNPEQVTAYYGRHPQLAPVLERFGGFDVYASPWFAAIYLLLFTSLIGCVLPRMRDLIRGLRIAVPDAPKRLDRLPQFAQLADRPQEPAVVAAGFAADLRRRRFRTVVREQTGGGWTVSAEKGYLKEIGNLLFHLALLVVLIGVGFGHWYGWHGNRLLVAGDDHGFCNVVPQYDDSTLGPRVHAGDLPDFCLRLTGFDATYAGGGTPTAFRAHVRVSENGGSWRDRSFSVNDPLRLSGTAVHLLGHGYAPVLRYTDRFGAVQTKVVPFLPTDNLLTSEGVAQFPDVNIDPATNRRDERLQVGFEGVFLPTAATDGRPQSTYPGLRKPELFLTAYRGDLGLDVGVPGSVYALDRAQVANGELKQVSGVRPHQLTPGATWTLDDGTTLEFVGLQQFVTLSIRHDPTQLMVLVGAVCGLLGLTLSLGGHRRRVWLRADPGPDGAAGSVVQAGGLPRTDYPGFGDEFAALVGKPCERDT